MKKALLHLTCGFQLFPNLEHALSGGMLLQMTIYCRMLSGHSIYVYRLEAMQIWFFWQFNKYFHRLQGIIISERIIIFKKKKSKIRHFLTKSYLFLRFEVWTWKSDKSYNISFSWSFFSFFLFLTHFYILILKNILHFFAKFCVFSHFYIGFWERKTILNVAIEFNLPLQSYEFISSTKNCLFHWRSSLNSAHSIPIHAIPFDCCCIFSLFSA